MGYRWSKFSLRRLYGLDLKTNVMDVKDGYSLGGENCFQNGKGFISKKNGTKPMFSSDSNSQIAEIGAATISGTKYYFRIVDGDFHYSTSKTGAVTVLSPTPAIDTSNDVWWAALEERVYFVDGTNMLRYFDGSAIVDAEINPRPTAAPTGSGGSGFDFVYTTDNGQGQSPSSPPLVDDGSTATITVPNAQIETGWKIRIYSRATSIAAASVNVTGNSGGSNVTYGSDELGNYALVTSGASDAVITTVAIADGLVQLYTELGEAINKSAPTGLEGIANHYGRLVGWIGDTGFYVSKQFNASSWPATENKFFYPNNVGSDDPITSCVSFLESLYVLQEKNVTVFGGPGPDDTGANAFSERRLEANGNGCVAGKSAKVIEDTLVYLSRNGFYGTNGTDPVRIGEKIEPEIQALSKANLQSACAYYHKKDGIYVCAVGASNSRVLYSLDVRKDNNELVGWFKWTGNAARCFFYDENEFLAGYYNGLSVYEETTGITGRYADAVKESITDAEVDTATDILTVSRVYSTGDAIKFRTTGTPPTGLSAGTTYYAIYVSDTEIQLAASEADALAGTEIDITGAGSGTFYLIEQVPFSAFYITNWFNFKHPSHVKKLGKLGLLFDASASNININVKAGYNWATAFEDQGNVTITSTHLWGSGLWGSFAWGTGGNGEPKNVAISRRKVRSIRYRFENSSPNSDFSLLGIEQNFQVLRNRGNFA